jgi:DnaD/phage-associated family protein
MTDQRTKPERPVRWKDEPEDGCNSWPVFVKISTSLKNSLPSMDANALKVWLYLAFSLNRDTEQAHPGIRAIAKGCGLAPNTVTAAVKRLEAQGLLLVNREKRKCNIYEIPVYISVNSNPIAIIDAHAESAANLEPIVESVAIKDGSVANLEPSAASVSIESASVAMESKSVAASGGLNQINQIQPDNNTNNNTGAVFKSFESEIGPITPMIRDAIKDSLDNLKVPPEWIIEAIELCAAHNKRNWAYCAAILNNWTVNGKNALPDKPPPRRSKYRPRGDHSDFFKLLEKA